MQFDQKKNGTQTRFEFEDERLIYAVKDDSGSREEQINYTRIAFRTREVIEQNTWLRNVGLLWSAIGAIGAATRLAGISLSGLSGIWLIIGLGCLGVWRLRKTTYTVFDTDDGPIFIADDSQKEAIVNEIHTRRDALFRLRFGDVNLENDPDAEIRKFQRLKENKVITPEEYDEKTRLIGAAEPPENDAPRLLN
ncbi:MAG: hypothetical protein AAFQ67_10025 [Pseudomonadota bacterium]